jgi:hypothetical protein
MSSLEKNWVQIDTVKLENKRKVESHNKYTGLTQIITWQKI